MAQVVFLSLSVLPVCLERFKSWNKVALDKPVAKFVSFNDVRCLPMGIFHGLLRTLEKGAKGSPSSCWLDLYKDK